MSRPKPLSFVLLFLGLLFVGQSQPLFCADDQIAYRPQGYVSDFVGVIAPQDNQEISRLLTELEQKTTAQVAVVSVSTVEPDSIEEFAVKLFKQWGIGQKGKDNGVLLLIAVKDRRVRIETGYGLEGALPDVVCNKIIQSLIVPNFKKEQYSQGIKEGVKAIVSLAAKEYNIEVSGVDIDTIRSSNDYTLTDLLLILVFCGFIFFIFYFISQAYGGAVRGSGRRGGRYWSGGGGGFGGGGFGGSSGSGFGGFGGGMSGGGGASGRW